jgi:hypothetical protein
MYRNLQQRFHDTLIDATDFLIGMALDPRLMPGVAAEMRSVRSAASTPSLRSREGSVTPVGRMDAPGGNVRVVVRVRAFLPRGKNPEKSREPQLTPIPRARERRRMLN